MQTSVSQPVENSVGVNSATDNDTRDVDFRLFRKVDSDEVDFPAGTEIMTPGETSRTMYIIKSGVVAVQVNGKTVDEFGEGKIFGEMGIVDPKPHTASVIAKTDVVAYAVSEQQFLQMISTAPTFALRVMRVLARRARAMNTRMSGNS